MITLLTGLLGVFSSALPRLLGFIQTWQDHRHELAMATLQIQAQREGIGPRRRLLVLRAGDGRQQEHDDHRLDREAHHVTRRGGSGPAR